MGFMSGISSAVGKVFSPGGATAMLSGIPFVGEGFAQQEQQRFGADQSSAQMAFQAQQSQKQMDFQSQMSGTAHQREVADLKAAGLNPMLSGTGGSGASSPSGSAGSGASASSSAQSGASSAAKLLQSIYTKERETAQTGIDRNKADTDLSRESARTQIKQQGVLQNAARKASAEAKLAEFELPDAINRSDFAKKYGKTKLKADALMDVSSKGASTVKDILEIWRGGRLPRSAPMPQNGYSPRPYSPSNNQNTNSTGGLY